MAVEESYSAVDSQGHAGKVWRWENYWKCSVSFKDGSGTKSDWYPDLRRAKEWCSAQMFSMRNYVNEKVRFKRDGIKSTKGNL